MSAALIEQLQSARVYDQEQPRFAVDGDVRHREGGQAGGG
jgi:hypothetical protein